MREAATRSDKQRGLAFSAVVVLLTGTVAKTVVAHTFMFRTITAGGVMSDVVVLGAAMALIACFGGRYRVVILTVASGIVGLWLWASVLYGHFFVQLLTFATVLEESANTGQVIPLLPELLMRRHVLLFADTLAATVLLAASGPEGRRAWSMGCSRWARLTAGVTVAAAIVAVGLASATSPSADHQILAQRRGILAAQIVSSAAARRMQAPVPSDVDVADANSLRTAVGRLTGSDTHPTNASGWRVPDGTNVILVVFEALQNIVIDESVGGLEVTPNLNELASQGYYFPQTFSQVGKGNTSDAEFTINTGWYSPAGRAPSIWYSDRVLTGLPRTLADNGYATVTMHTNDVSFWSRDQLYPALGFEKYYDRSTFGTDDLYLGWGRNDGVLFKKAEALLTDMHADGRPFLAEIVTLSSHAPFSPVPRQEHGLDLPREYEGTVAGDYLEAIHYSDEKLGEFVDALEQQGVLADTILVVVGDHGGLFPDDSGAARLAEDLKNRDYQAADYLNVPLFIRPPGGMPGCTVPQTVGHADIAVTLLDSLGLSDGFISLGGNAFAARDVVLPTRGRVPDGSYVTGDAFYLAGLTVEEGVRLGLPGFAPEPLSEDGEDYWERSRAMLGLSAAYLDSLPYRDDTGDFPTATQD